jgi:hypothetical protein
MAFQGDHQDRAKKACRMGWIGCTIWLVAQKAIMEFEFLAYSFNVFSEIKPLSNDGKTF